MSENTRTDAHDDDATPPRGVAPAAGASAANAGRTADAIRRAKPAATVARTIETISAAGSVPVSRAQRSAFLRQVAGRTRTSVGLRVRLKGHLFEDLDIDAYNRANEAVGKQLRRNADPLRPAYDADRFIDGKYAGSVQHKTFTTGMTEAVEKMDAKKPGSAKLGTIRVPGDKFDEAVKRTRGRARVSASDVTTDQLNETLDTGLDALAKGGLDATSKTRALAKGAGQAGAMSAAIGGVAEVGALLRGDVDAKAFASRRAQEAGEAAVATTVAAATEKFGKATAGTSKAVAHGAARAAVVTVTVSSLRDVPSLVRGDMSVRDFAEKRGVDAAEAATATAVATATTGAILATGTGATASAAAGGAAAWLADAGASAAAKTGTAFGARAATALGGVTAAAAGPAIVGGAVVVGTGIVVGRGFSKLRTHVKRKQAERKGSKPVAAEAVPAGTPGKPMAKPDIAPVASELTLNGAIVFTEEQAASIRAVLLSHDGADGERTLAELDFVMADWAGPGHRFGIADFDALVEAGYIRIQAW